MKKVIPNGQVIKRQREQLERKSTQKEFAYEIGVSERKLRQIENANAPIDIIILDKLAKLFDVHREVLVFSSNSQKLAASTIADGINRIFESDGEIMPRYDYDIAEVTVDAGHILHEANKSHDVDCIINTALNEETEEYARELFGIITSLSWSKRSILDKVDAAEEITIRCRIRQLLVLLRGNDIWVYQTRFFRTLPESHVVPPEDEPHWLESRFVVALGPPGEYGETSIHVPIDHGRPWVLCSLKAIQDKKSG